jgi:sialate O-acetylesterase
MVFALKGSDGAKEEIAVANYPAIRYFSVKRQYGPKQFEDAPASVWKKTSPETAPAFSAVAYYFAKKIHKDLKVPVGIVYAAWGGTPAEAWTPKEILRSDDSLSVYIDRWKKIQDSVEKDSIAYLVELSKWGKDSTASKKPAEPQTLYYYKRPWREPGVLFNGMINPVIPYSIKGVLWYQGESNVSYADEYENLFSTLIKSWREKWNATNSPTFPFYFVQLPPFGYSDLDAAPRLRKAQQDVANKVLHTGMIATIDLGNMKDIHPTRKKEVGERLALLALNKTYGFSDLVYSGPVFKKAINKNAKVHISFNQKLFTVNHQKAGGFEIGHREAGSDSLIFVKAEATIKNNEVIVWNETVQKPLVIRYAWLDIEEANLVNETMLPALPFSEKIK